MITIDRFSMIIPGRWTVLPLSADRRDQRIAAIVADRVGKGDQLAHVRRQLTVRLRQAAAEAHTNGAFFAALFDEVAAGAPISASVIASLTPLLKGRAGELLETAEDIQRALTSGDPSTRAEVLEHSLVNLEVGRACRLRKRTGAGVRSPEGREPSTENVEFFVPHPEAGKMLTLAYSTPVLPLADAFTELFDVMAASAAWLEADDRSAVRP